MILKALGKRYNTDFDIMDITGLPSGTDTRNCARFESAGLTKSKWKRPIDRTPNNPTARYLRTDKTGIVVLPEAGQTLSTSRRYVRRAKLIQSLPMCKSSDEQTVRAFMPPRA